MSTTEADKGELIETPPERSTPHAPAAGASVKRRAMHGAIALTGGQALGQVMSLVRNILIARWIGPAEFGLAATFVVMTSLIDLVSDLAIDKLLIQANDGDDPSLQSNAQLLQALRGAVAALAILLIAGPMTALFKAPDALSAYRWLALFPLIRGFAHLDMVRAQRQLRFAPSILVDVGSQAASLAIAWPLAIWLGDHRVALGVILAQAVAFVVGSHIVARRPYQLRWSGEVISRFARFGWPLLLNGLLLWVILQGDKVIVGAAYSKEDLGVYAAAFGLAMLPGLLLARVNRTLFLPLLARSQSEPAQFARRYATSAQFTSALAAGLAVGCVVAGSSLIQALYGREYASGGAVLGWIGLMTATRVARGTPSVAAVALGDTTNPMWANVARVATLALAIGAAAMRQPLAMIAAAGFLGELVAMYVATRRLQTRRSISMTLTARPGLIAGGVVALLCLPALALGGASPVVSIAAGVVCAGLAVLAVGFSGRDLRSNGMAMLIPAIRRLQGAAGRKA